LLGVMSNIYKYDVAYRLVLEDMDKQARILK
jgi:hypothetical protein